jgi:hypothetical protein
VAIPTGVILRTFRTASVLHTGNHASEEWVYRALCQEPFDPRGIGKSELEVNLPINFNMGNEHDLY